MRVLSVIFCLGASGASFAQPTQVGVIDYYGPKSAEAIKHCIPFQEQDTLKFLTDSLSYVTAKDPIVNCLLQLPNVKQADISFVCCLENKWMAFIGTSDKPKAAATRNTKVKDLKLPGEIVNAYDSLMNLLMAAVQNGQANEDDSEGHALFAYPPARRIQERFKTHSKTHLAILKEVIHHSKYPHQRAIATTVIAYYYDKKAIVSDLVEGVSDENEDVRNDATRAIAVLQGFADGHPDLLIQVSADPFIANMNSISWTDRNKSALMLFNMTRSRDPKLLLQIKQQALQPLSDMALWKSAGHASTGFFILGRIAGFTEEEINDGMQDRPGMVAKMLAKIK